MPLLGDGGVAENGCTFCCTLCCGVHAEKSNVAVKHVVTTSPTGAAIECILGSVLFVPNARLPLMCFDLAEYAFEFAATEIVTLFEGVKFPPPMTVVVVMDVTA